MDTLKTNFLWDTSKQEKLGCPALQRTQCYRLSQGKLMQHIWNTELTQGFYT